MIHFFVKPASSRCEWRQTGRPPPSPAGLDGGRRRWQGRLLERFAVEIRLVICSLACRKNLAGEVAHFEIPYSSRAIFSASVHPPSLCLGIINIKLDGRFCVSNLETNCHDVLADAFKVDHRSEVARGEVKHPENVGHDLGQITLHTNSSSPRVPDLMCWYPPAASMLPSGATSREFTWIISLVKSVSVPIVLAIPVSASIPVPETSPGSLDVGECECKHQNLPPRIWLCDRSLQWPR